MEKEKRGEIVIYEIGSRGVEVKMEGENFWLSQKEIARVFEVDRTVITRHISNIIRSNELDSKSNVQKMHIANADRPVNYYSLDVILSVGYRVSSKKATSFRIWATRTLKDYLVKGYAVNQNLLSKYQEKLLEFQETLAMIAQKSGFELLKGHERELIDLISEYAKSWKVLEAYDDDKLTIKKTQRQVKFEISYDGAIEMLGEMRDQLFRLKVNVSLFGQENGQKLHSITGAINQTFDGKDLYPSVEEKAANLLYFVIKDHPFADGNKRIGSMLFIYFLENNSFLYHSNGERKISANTLIALALLVATSDPKEKDNVVKLIINLIQS